MTKCPNPECGCDLASVLVRRLPATSTTAGTPDGEAVIIECPHCGRAMAGRTSFQVRHRDTAELKVIQHRPNVIGRR
jgi:predicted RNA-binding Zn-ribbon protein involved in translation (DUF1610 family)